MDVIEKSSTNISSITFFISYSGKSKFKVIWHQGFMKIQKLSKQLH